MAYAVSHFSHWEADDGLDGRQLSSSLPLLKHAFPRNSLMDWKKRELCGRYLPFVVELEIRELDFVYAVGVMLVPRLRADQALVYMLSL